jgi:ubiquinone/menaquinone biosynthesis C-methylase UbiE
MLSRKLTEWRTRLSGGLHRSGDRPRHAAALSARYDQVAGAWHGMVLRLGYATAYREFMAAVRDARLLPTKMGGMRILDIGTGTGAFALAMHDVAGPTPSVDLIDASLAMLMEAEARFAEHGLQPRLRHGHADRDRIGCGQFDLIGAAHVVEHFDDLEKGLVAMAEALAPGGRILLVVSQPHWCNRLVWLRWRHRSHDEAAMRAVLDSAGLSVLLVHRFGSGPPSRTSLGYVACLGAPRWTHSSTFGAAPA